MNYDFYYKQKGLNLHQNLIYRSRIMNETILSYHRTRKKKKKENLHRFALNEMAIGKGFPSFFSQNLDS